MILTHCWSNGWAGHYTDTLPRKHSGCGNKEKPQVGLLLLCPALLLAPSTSTSAQHPTSAPSPTIITRSEALALTSESPSAHTGISLMYESPRGPAAVTRQGRVHKLSNSL